MPGGRLSYEDRRRIAAGLSAGHSYAEIARDLERPKSTISREVARNGGAGHYRANLAQQATSWRARRKPGPLPAAPVAADTHGRDLEAVRQFEERFAGMMIQTGVPPMAARVFVRLFTSDAGSCTAAELVALLQVSPASISKAVGWLAARGLLRRERDGRRERYVIDDTIWYQTWQASVRSMMMWRDLAQEGGELLGADSPAGTRLCTTSRFFQLLGHDMVQAAEHWRRTLR
ncbi:MULTISPECIES: helix-turn-helix domain-containing protein [unclassified Nonomuraea]|uniref:helix-turn-helix domain-containing protein n=1 Tax=unclassified Nonomuraea TaxID=2593643 RepID=UPI0033D1EBC9